MEYFDMVLNEANLGYMYDDGYGRILIPIYNKDSFYRIFPDDDWEDNDVFFQIGFQLIADEMFNKKKLKLKTVRL